MYNPSTFDAETVANDMYKLYTTLSYKVGTEMAEKLTVAFFGAPSGKR